MLLPSMGHNFKYRVFPNASHGLRVNGQIVDDYWKIQDDFLREIGWDYF